MVYFAEATLRFDGNCRPNPGVGGSGWELVNDRNNRRILQGQYFVGYNATNNVAEYKGLIGALKQLRDSNHTVGRLTIEGDSQLVINQMKGNYSVRSPGLRPLYYQAQRLIKMQFSKDWVKTYSFRHIYRSENQQADKLANDAIDDEDNWSQDLYG